MSKTGGWFLDLNNNNHNGRSNSEKYVCAFRGRRDYYQAPLALAEAGLLDEFITDAYALPAFRRVVKALPSLQQKILFRREPGIPDGKVKCLWGTTAVERVRHGLGISPSITFAKLDAKFSLAAARRASSHRANLFLYSPYAWEAFVARYPHTPRKVLFQYHPHQDMEEQILAADRRKYPFVNNSFEEESGKYLTAKLKQRVQDSWRHADLIFCASNFTKQSLLHAGVNESLCRTVPYGIEVVNQGHELRSPDDFRVLFVGSGGQRKGLHHLLLAWAKATLPGNSRLTLVCRTIDKSIERLAMETAGVELVRGLSGTALQQQFANSTLFAMPSLVEGFGQVFLEALAQGCPVLGTPNTCLPDIGGEGEGIYVVEPGNVDELIARLESLATWLPGNVDIRIRALQCAKRFSWGQFRSDLTAALS